MKYIQGRFVYLIACAPVVARDMTKCGFGVYRDMQSFDCLHKICVCRELLGIYN